jgi:hypothetical protein
MTVGARSPPQAYRNERPPMLTLEKSMDMHHHATMYRYVERHAVRLQSRMWQPADASWRLSPMVNISTFDDFTVEKDRIRFMEGLIEFSMKLLIPWALVAPNPASPVGTRSACPTIAVDRHLQDQFAHVGLSF